MANKEEAREVWEYEIDDFIRRSFQTHDSDDLTVRDEKAALIACLVMEYEHRFGKKFPNALTRL